jgi:hypothetical protein
MTRSQRWAARNPAKRAAHNAVYNALRRGDLVRGDCAGCGVKHGATVGGKRACVQAAHDDYARPLDVVWLCATCHIGKAHWQDGDFRARCRGVAITVNVTINVTVNVNMGPR